MESSSAQKEIKADKKRSVFFIVFCSVREKRIKSLIFLPVCAQETKHKRARLIKITPGTFLTSACALKVMTL